MRTARIRRLKNKTRKGLFEVPPTSKEAGCRFYGDKLPRAKATVRKVVQMNYSPLSVQTLHRITHGAASWWQNEKAYDDYGSHYYKVTYPNGFGVSIVGYPYFDGQRPCWRVALMKDGKLCIKNDGTVFARYLRSEGEVGDFCRIVSKAKPKKASRA